MGRKEKRTNYGGGGSGRGGGEGREECGGIMKNGKKGRGRGRK